MLFFFLTRGLHLASAPPLRCRKYSGASAANHLQKSLNRSGDNSVAMNKIAIVVFTASLSASSLKLAKADQRGADWMPAELVTQTIIQFGYTEVTKLKADGGEWEGEGVKNGQKMEFRADPRTGAIIEEELDD